MNNKIFVFSALFLALTLSIVYAQEAEPITSSEEPVVAVEEEKGEPIEDMAILLVSPADGIVYEFPSSIDANAMNIGFSFLVEPVTPQNVEAQCNINIEGTQDYIFSAQMTDTGEGSASGQFGVGTYSWRVECVKQGVTFTSENTYSFEVKNTPPVIINNPTNNPTNNNGGSSNNDDDEGSNRRLQPITAPLQELSNTETTGSESTGSPGITGAVTGLMSKKTLTGIVVLAVVLGIAGLVIYNRRKLGVVKN